MPWSYVRPHIRFHLPIALCTLVCDPSCNIKLIYFQSKHQSLQDEVIRLRARLQSIKDDPEQLGGEPILPPFTPNSMPADQSIINQCSPFRPLARVHAARPMVELDMDSEDDDTTEADSNETQTFEEIDMHFG